MRPRFGEPSGAVPRLRLAGVCAAEEETPLADAPSIDSEDKDP
jgi:hypothetical protein